MSDRPNWRSTSLLRAYARVTALASPAVDILTRRRLARGKEDPARVGERRGIAGLPRPEGPLVWLHGASVGEFLSLVPLIERLQDRGLNVLVTTVTLTAAALAARRLPPGAIHQFVPWDVPHFIDRFLDHWRPDIVIFAESELWPNMILRTTARGAPLIQVNGRLSERSFRGWQRVRRSIGTLLSRFELSLMQSVDDARRIEALGAPRVITTGNLKFDVPALTADPDAHGTLARAVAGRPVALAASTHDGEETEIIAAHAIATRSLPGLLTIIAPRHPERGPAVEALVAAAGLGVARRSTGALPTEATGIYVADTLGEMGLFYRVATVAFLGGSLIRHGGQNPIEPAKLGSAVIHGPHVQNFAAVYRAFADEKAARQVADAAGLAETLVVLLSEPATRTAQCEAAFRVVIGLGGALERTMASIEPYFLALAARKAAA